MLLVTSPVRPLAAGRMCSILARWQYCSKGSWGRFHSKNISKNSNCSGQQQHWRQHWQHWQRAAAAAPTDSVDTETGSSAVAQLGAVAALAGLWVLVGRPAPASAAVLPRPVTGVAQLETMVAISPPAAAVTSVASPNDSMLMIVAVCLSFWMVSAFISAAIGAVMKVSGRSLPYGTRGAATWTSAGILDTFDIMRLPLAYEIEEPRAGSKAVSSSGSGSIAYVPWEGPASYIPVSMVKVLRPGLKEAGLVARPSMLQPDQNLSIISIDSSSSSSSIGADLPRNGNGQKSNGSSNNGNGNGNGKHKPNN